MKTSFINHNHLLSGALFIVLILLCITPATSTSRQAGGNTDRPGKGRKQIFTDEDLKVETINGKWSAQSVADLKQFNDPSIPVIVNRINTSWGKDKYVGRMKVSEVVLENRGQKTTRLVQLRWTIVSVDNPDVTLLEGVTPLSEAEINPNSKARVDIPEIYFNKLLKPLKKNDELNGHFRLVLGVREVHFADDSIWQPAQVSFLRTSYRSYFVDSPKPQFRH